MRRFCRVCRKTSVLNPDTYVWTHFMSEPPPLLKGEEQPQVVTCEHCLKLRARRFEQTHQKEVVKH